MARGHIDREMEDELTVIVTPALRQAILGHWSLEALIETARNLYGLVREPTRKRKLQKINTLS